MKLNRYQRITFTGAAAVLAASAAVWIATGAHIFTKQQIPVQRYDELLGSTYTEWQDVFTVGLDIAVPIALGTLVLASLLAWLFRTKKDFQTSNLHHAQQ